MEGGLSGWMVGWMGWGMDSAREGRKCKWMEWDEINRCGWDMRVPGLPSLWVREKSKKVKR